MSASREKKIRQDRVTQGIPDPKAERLAKEAAKERRSNVMYIAIAAVFVIVAAVLLVINSGVIQKNSTAATVNGEKFTPAEVSYYYTAAYSNVASSDYYSYFGIDTSASLSSQSLSDTAKLLLGVEEDMTWDAYLKETALTSLAQNTAMVKAAEDAGFEFTDEMQAEVDEAISNMETNASTYGYTTSSYLKALYGEYMTSKVLKSILHDIVLVNYFKNDYLDSLDYTDDDLQAYYEENADDFDVCSYNYIYFNGTASSTTDSNGNTVEATDEEQAAALQAAQDASSEALTRFESGESMEDIAESYDIATYHSIEDASYSSATIIAWAFDSSRTAGEYTVLQDGNTFYLVQFLSRHRNDYNTVDVRHILISADTSDLDSTSDTYEADYNDIWSNAEATAESLYEEWKSGDATEDSFAELANENSADTGSNTTGGLYEQVYEGEMVTTFNDWCFDASRQPGDTGIIESSYGYHIMYFVGQDEVYWKVQVRDEMTTNDYSTWTSGITDGYTAEAGSGMKYVGQ